MLLEIILIILVVVLLIKNSRRPENYPPGPRGLPLLGYAPFLSKHHPIFSHLALQSLSKIYGPVVGFYMGTQPFVSVCGHEAVREALNNDDLNGRPSNATLRARYFHKKLGIIFTDSELWQEQRRFSLRHLRDLGFGKTSIESQMMDEVHDLLEDLKASAKRATNGVVDFKGTFGVSVVNVLWAIMGGERYRRDDARFRQLLLDVELSFRTGNPLLATIPFPEVLFKKYPAVTRLLDISNDTILPLQRFVQKTVEEHMLDRVEGAPRDFIDVYLDEMEKQSKTGQESSFSIEQLVATIQDLFGAGAETTSGSIGFAILHLIHRPEVQRKMQTEMDFVCGDSLPSLNHRTNLPYTDAVLMESMRISSVTPLPVPHFALRDTKLQGYNIPKGTLVMPNFHSVFNDANYWKDPEVFRPERFLNQDETLNKRDHLFPFGLGRRMCLGEPLANKTYFLFTASLIKSFTFESVPGESLPTLDPLNGFTLSYQGFRALVTPRN